ncbi:hypothetical protein DL95DRAFT_301978 [Leptodontidium sp. 2 PMI_412]|nr:hypothetical protein DL95DRAFT_301978 [Leptodontidium sp. 2 PMI_412]
MSKDVSSHQNSIRTTLLACLLILCFEAWNGNLKLAVGQVRAGIALILEWKAAHGGLNDARLSSEPGIIEADLIQIFCRLAIQSIFFGFELTAPSRSLLGAEGRSLVRSMPTAFVDLSHAATYQQSLIRRGTYLFGAHVRTYPSFVNHTILPELFAAQVEFRADSLKWLQAFDPLFTSAPPGRSLQFARMMKLQVLISYAYASTAFSTNDDAHEGYRDCWNVGVRLAEEVLTDKYWAKDDKPANYCFDSRVVMPLWMAGIHCRDDMRRNKVIELLLKFPRREGIWDSIWAGKMLQWVAGLERCFRGLDGHIPEWARIRDLKWTSDFEKRSSLLSCRQRISSSSLDVEEKTTRVFW